MIFLDVNLSYVLIYMRVGLEFFQFIECEFMSTEWTVELFFQPRLETFIMEKMLAHSHSHQILVDLEVFQTNSALISIKCLLHVFIQGFSRHEFVDLLEGEKAGFLRPLLSRNTICVVIHSNHNHHNFIVVIYLPLSVLLLYHIKVFLRKVS